MRIFLLHHMTWSINSVCHFFGARRFETEDQSHNVFWLALPSLGEAWHHNHHAFPHLRLPRPAPLERLADPSGLVIAGWRRSGWSGTSCGSARSARRERRSSRV